MINTRVLTTQEQEILTDVIIFYGMYYKTEKMRDSDYYFDRLRNFIRFVVAGEEVSIHEIIFWVIRYCRDGENGEMKLRCRLMAERLRILENEAGR